MKLRDYQVKAVEAVIEAWKTARSCLLVLPTGCGKTVVFGEVIRRLLTGAIDTHGSPHRAMILAHREELITQAEQKVGNISCGSVGVEMGQREAVNMLGSWPQTVVSSVQTQITGRMHKFEPDDFSVLVIDEAHHATSKSYRMCVEHYMKNPNCRLLGVTATPDRADNLALGTVFDTVAYEYSIDKAIDDGWLVPVKQKLVEVGSLDYSKVSTCAGDFNQGELAEVLESEKNLHGIAYPTLQICGKKRAIIFATSVKQAERLAEILNRYEETDTDDGATVKAEEDASPAADGTTKKRAEWICGKTDKETRRGILDRFKKGDIQFIVNVGVLTEGFDDSGVEVVVMARPTKSRALYAQMAGRATRPAEEVAGKLGDVERQERLALIAKSSKPSCLIVDFVGNSGRHKLVTAIDILGGKELDPDEEEAQAIVKQRCQESEDGLDTKEELAKARAEIKARKEEEAKRRAFIQISAKYTVRPVDPFNIYDVRPVRTTEKSPLDRRMLSFKQRAILRERVGINPDTLTIPEQHAYLDAHFGRRERGMATLKQTKYLRKHGYLTPMSFEEANAMISRVMQRGGRHA